MREHILITGSNGYIAKKLAALFEQNGADVSYATLRASNPFGNIPPEQVTLIVHAAAATRFNIDQATAQAVNIDGSRKVFDYAQKCANLRRLALLSTIYSSGLQKGTIEEEPLKGHREFSNFYEWSKWTAEKLLLSDYHALPWQIYRIATVIADHRSGEVRQYNAFHNTMKLIYYGLLSVIPGDPNVPLYFVTGDFTANAIYAGLSAHDHSIYHVAHTKEESARLGDIIDQAYETFSGQEEFRKKRILKPLFSDRESFELLTHAVEGFGGAVVTQALGSITPFAQQLFVYKDVRNAHLREVLPDYSAPEPLELVRNTSKYLCRTNWGKLNHG